MMTTIGDIWDRTIDVLAGRARVIVPIAVGALFLPAVVQAATRALTIGPDGRASTASTIATIVAAAVSLWARLAITGVALHPDTTGAQARAQAGRRLLPMIGVLLVLAAAGIVLLVPFVVVLDQAGIDWPALAASGTVTLPVLSRGAALFVSLYSVALAALALWVVARVKLLLASVVLDERRVIGAIGRATELSRGMTWRLIGVVLLYYVVLWVCVLATTAVAGLLFRLLLGGGAWAGLLATVTGAAVGVAFDTIAQVFATRLYVAVTGADARAA